jgi:hypothetical protein
MLTVVAVLEHVRLEGGNFAHVRLQHLTDVNHSVTVQIGDADEAVRFTVRSFLDNVQEGGPDEFCRHEFTMGFLDSTDLALCCGFAMIGIGVSLRRPVHAYDTHGSRAFEGAGIPTQRRSSPI